MQVPKNLQIESHSGTPRAHPRGGPVGEGRIVGPRESRSLLRRLPDAGSPTMGASVQGLTQQQVPPTDGSHLYTNVLITFLRVGSRHDSPAASLLDVARASCPLGWKSP